MVDEIAPCEAAIRVLVRELSGDDVEVRKRAADVARRVTERDAAPLRSYVDELAGLLAALPEAESWTRRHLGLLVIQRRSQVNDCCNKEGRHCWRPFFCGG